MSKNTCSYDIAIIGNRAVRMSCSSKAPHRGPIASQFRVDGQDRVEVAEGLDQRDLWDINSGHVDPVGNRASRNLICALNATADLGPQPRTPATLSDASPTSAR